MSRDQERAVMAALLAYSNMGVPLTGPHADKDILRKVEWLKKHPSTDPRSNIIQLCAHLIESDEAQKCWEAEARSWSGTLRKMKRSVVATTWPDIWAMVVQEAA